MYEVGDKIVYPMQGAGVISEIETREIDGEEVDYYIIDVSCRNMELIIPVTAADDASVRPVVDRETIEKVIEVLAAESTPMDEKWNRRNRENMEKLKTGEIKQVAEVVRNLSRLKNEKSLSAGERKMLNNAAQILRSEMELVLEISEQEAEKKIKEAIAQNE